MEGIVHFRFREGLFFRAGAYLRNFNHQHWPNFWSTSVICGISDDSVAQFLSLCRHKICACLF